MHTIMYIIYNFSQFLIYHTYHSNIERDILSYLMSNIISHTSYLTHLICTFSYNSMQYMSHTSPIFIRGTIVIITSQKHRNPQKNKTSILLSKFTGL